MGISLHDNLKGLSAAEVVQSRARYGSNILVPPPKESLWKQFWEKFADPLIIILMVAGGLSIGISSYEFFGLHQGFRVFFEPLGIFVAIFLATGLAFYFEHKADNEFALLNQVNDDEPVTVIRDGNTTIVPRKDIVVGDIVLLNAGDEVPADGDLIESVSLNVDESALTGEPSAMKTTDESQFKADATYPSNHLLRGSKVLEGHAIMRVTLVGKHTEMGKVFVDAQIDDSVKTPLNEQLDRLGKFIANFSYIFAAAIIVGRLLYHFEWAALGWVILLPVAVFFWMVINKFKEWSKGRCFLAIAISFIVFIGVVTWVQVALNGVEEFSELLAFTLQTLMLAVTLIVVSVPEGLPMAVTLSLALSMRRMFKTNNLVRKLHACETMGAATVICTDKTGTLTQNRMQVAEAQFYGDTSEKMIAEAMALNTTANLDVSKIKLQPLGNPTEGALLLYLSSLGISYREIRSEFEIVAELPFSTIRKYMATVVRSLADGRLTLHVKGAPEIVLEMCKSVAGNVPREQILAQLADHQSHAMRTLGFACAPLTTPDGIFDGDKVNCDTLKFIGITAILDPVREDVPAAVEECREAGIDIKIVTGDTPAIAREIGRRINLITDADGDECVITGPEFAELSDSEIDERVKDLKIIARARPTDKKRLVESLQRRGEVVAVTGDGTNDAPALKAAQVGLSMGDGTSVAKEASDITIIDNSFSSIGRAVMWGRSLYRNIQRFLIFQLTVNVAACFLVLFGSVMGAEPPLTITQMLWVNLIMDTFGAMALASLPPSPQVMHDKPRDRRKSIITRGMTWNILGVGGFFFLILVVLLYIFQHAEVNTLSDLCHVHLGARSPLSPFEDTVIFSIFVWTHFWYMFNTRGFMTGRSALDLKGCNGFITIAIVIVVGQLLITEVGYEFFNVEPLLHTADWQFNPEGARDLGIIVGLSSLVLWGREVYRLVYNHTHRGKQQKL